MSRFDQTPQRFFDAIYQDTPPWDIGGPQPALMDLVRRHPPASPILDVGCGTGDLAIALAQDGLEVIGADSVAAAIERARGKAANLDAAVRERISFRVADARRPSQLGQRFGAVVDSGFLHLLEPSESDAFLQDVARTLALGGRYYLLAFAVAFDIPNTPRAVTEREVRERFTMERGWTLRSCYSAEFQSRIAPVAATCACAERVR